MLSMMNIFKFYTVKQQHQLLLDHLHIRIILIRNTVKVTQKKPVFLLESHYFHRLAEALTLHQSLRYQWQPW